MLFANYESENANSQLCVEISKKEFCNMKGKCIPA